MDVCISLDYSDSAHTEQKSWSQVGIDACKESIGLRAQKTSRMGACFLFLKVTFVCVLVHLRTDKGSTAGLLLTV